ncbi:MAG: phasin family protein, partial [Sphingomonadales bacterium]|nr:phasin family protein [Sphingomonadales bacterium]
AEASVDAPVASVAADLGQTVLDYWTQQADSLWSHSVTLSQARSVSDVIEAQGHFIRQQVEIARAQSATWSSLFNQTMGLSVAERLPAFSVWAPWQTTICKPGG